MIGQALRQAPDTPANRNQAGHVIGMERWGTQRLASLINGTVAAMDEYDSYRPSADLDLPALADEFLKVRADTLFLAARLEPYAQKKVMHNDIGLLSVKTWLVYLNNHSRMESKSIQ
jgi:hypothetical protein